MKLRQHTVSMRIRFVVALSLLLLTSIGRPHDTTALEGIWRVIDDVSGEPEALVRIEKLGGEYEGTVIKVIERPGVEPNPRCENCSGTLKNAPIVGLTILRKLKQQGDEYREGELLDPDTGHVYHCSAKLTANAQTLELRGYVGIPLFGRTQTWLRESTPVNK